ncbi:hypothetical protein H0H93_005729 [Arthromyces matolae]|nr:hypothetical protein H0H93_005729 [Arthromyces matolae]
MSSATTQLGSPPTSSSLSPTSTASFTLVTATLNSFTPNILHSELISTNASTSSTLQSQSSHTLSNSASLSSQTSKIHSAVCIGDGLDSSSVGLLSSLVIPSFVGFIILLLFAFLRPRLRQIYGLREWFVQSDRRPKPLGLGFFAFLFPHLPLVPSLPRNLPNLSRSGAGYADLFPSDEQLSQRIIWILLLIVVGWSIVGLGGALPLYLVSLPCLAESGAPSSFGGTFSVLEDLTLVRLLRLFDNDSVSSSSLISIRPRAGPSEDPQNARIRVIILTALTLALGLLPALFIVIKEFNRLVTYHQQFTELLCEGKEMGWLSARNAPGFVGWGEKRLKDFLLQTGLSYSMEARNGRAELRARNGNGNGNHHRSEEMQPLTKVEEAQVEVDIQSLFSIGDTHALALLIEERDEILENLEIAETRYISSFRVTTPEPSIADFQPPLTIDTDRPHISRPLPLRHNGSQRTHRGRRRHANPALAASSLAPTSFVAPSMYYKLRAVRGVSGGRFADSGVDQLPSVAESVDSHVANGRFLEMNQSSTTYGRLPTGSPEKSGRKRASSSFAANESMLSIPDPRRFGPNYAIDDSMIDEVDELGIRTLQYEEHEYHPIDEEWIDLGNELPAQTESVPNGPIPGPSTFRLRPKKPETVSSVRRETFPLRHDSTPDVRPPHLRLQPSQPFVRPLDGMNFDDLGEVYTDITQWRTRLKAINAAITEAQTESYNDIADGARIKGWLMVGRGLRHIPGIQLIEGRAKEDIRWDVLQNERSPLDGWVFWAIVVIVVVLLAFGLTAASGLALATAPGVAHTLSFLTSLNTAGLIPAGLASVFAPAVACTIFMSIAVYVVHWTADVYGSISISGGHLFIFKVTFAILALVATIWLTAVGALLYSFEAFNSHSGVAKSVANGSIYMGILALAIIFSIAIIFPGLLLLQPFRLWRVLRDERHAVTPRQRFRAVYPGTYNPSIATATSILSFVFASMFYMIFPLIGPAAAVLLSLTLIAHRYLVGYVYGRTHSKTGGLLQIWILKCFGILLALQPLLLGLIFLSREFWIEGGVLAGSSLAVFVFFGTYTSWKMRLPGRRSLSPITRNSLKTFEKAAWAINRYAIDDEGTSHGSSSGRNARLRGSMASVLEMMSVTLAVMPSNTNHRGPVPLPTETLDDLTATERAARTHPDAPPHLPPLAFTDHAEDMAAILYAPELIAPPPIIWLPNDSAGVASSEALDLQRYHDLTVTLDVRAKEDMVPMRSSSLRLLNTRVARTDVLLDIEVQPQVYKAVFFSINPLTIIMSSATPALDTGANDPYIAYSRALYEYTFNLWKEATRTQTSLTNPTTKPDDIENKKNDAQFRQE